MTQNAQIQIWTREVNGTSPFGDKAPQHTFFIKINDNGTREIIRGGPINDNMITDDIAVIKAPYNWDGVIKEDRPIDWYDPTKPNTSNYQGSTIKTSSQSEIDTLWNKAWSKAQAINSQSYDYETLTQNCNTTTYIMAREMGLVSQVESFLNQKKVWTPGFGNDFEHSLPDKGWDFLEEFPGNFKNDLNTIKDWLDDFKSSREFEDDNTTLKTSFNEKYSFKIKEGDKSLQLANSGMIATDAVYVDANGNPVSEYSALFKVEDDSGNIFTLVRDEVWTPLKDSTTATLNTIIDTIDSASTHIQSFFFGSIDFGKDLLSAVGSIFDNTHSQLFDQNNNPLYLDQNGNQTTESYHYLIDEEGNQILDEEGNPIKEENQKATNPSNLELLLADFAARVATGADIDEAALESSKTAIAREVSKELVAKIGLNDTHLQNGVAVAVARIGVMHMNGDDPNSQDYAMAAMEGILLAYGVPPAVVSGIIVATNKIIEEDGKLNANEYQDVAAIAATTAVVAVICIKVGAGVGAIVGGGPVGFVVGAVVGAVVGYLLAVPMYNAIRDGWEDSEQIYDAFEDIFKGDNIEKNLKEALKGYEDYAKTITIDFVKDVGRGAIKLFTGNYGKKYSPGEYPEPYDFLSISDKLDANGNPTGNHIIQGLDPEGITAIAREYYHDDIYGTSGSDNLIGRSGTNTIMGFEGNDHIEGRGDIDLLVGGIGDDEIFGGNGDDQIYGSQGNDLLFGGNGNDIIIGGSGATIGGSGSLDDGNDFIQGGNGDDQIMAEAGDDIIQGNAGNDTILGGTGNDRIKGDEGDDTILGEDGDDIMIAGAGSDIIDGGNGIDVIEGGEGNDNIRGGDGNDDILGNAGVDIIYGDAGSDLINTGSENDLAFGGLGNDIIYGADGNDTLSGEFGNDYVIGAEGSDTLDGGAGDDILFGGVGNDIITTSEGNDTIIYRIGDGDDIITDTDTTGNDVLKFSEINSKLSNNITDKVVLTKSGNDLLIQIKDDTNSIIANNSITVKDQFFGTEILKKIEFADGKSVDLTNIIINGDNSISYTASLYSNIDTSIQEELALGYNNQMQYQEEKSNPDSTFNANNYTTTGEQDNIDSERYNEVQWRSYKKKRSIFGGHYEVWYKYYEQNLNGANGNDRIVGSWWSENIYGGNGNDQLHGGDGDDNLFGGNGDDILTGGTGMIVFMARLGKI